METSTLTLAETRAALESEMQSLTAEFDGIDTLPDGPRQRYQEVTRGIRLIDEMQALEGKHGGVAGLPAGTRQRYDNDRRGLGKIPVRKVSGRPGGKVPSDKASRLALVAKMRSDAQRLGTGAPPAVPTPPAPAARNAGFNVNNRKPVDIYDRSGLDPRDPAAGGEIRSRGMWAIESWRSATPEMQQSAVNLINDPTSDQCRRICDLHILSASSPAYVRSFMTMLRTPPQVDSFGNPIPVAPFDPEERVVFTDVNNRAMTEQTIQSGQALMVGFLDPSIVFTSSGAQHPFRQLCTVKSVDTKDYLGVSSGGITAQYGQESGEDNDASPTLGGFTITPVRMSAFVQASQEWLRDASDAAEQLSRLFLDGRATLESTSWVSGTGSAQTPTGFTTALDAQTSSRISSQTSGVFGLTDVYAGVAALPPRFQHNATWAANGLTWNNLRQTVMPANLVDEFPIVEFPGDVPGKLGGKEFVSASGMVNTQTSGSDIAVVGDWRAGATVVDRVGTGVVLYESIHLMGPQRRPIASTAIYASWRTTFQIVAPQAFIMVRL